MKCVSFYGWFAWVYSEYAHVESWYCFAQLIWMSVDALFEFGHM